MIRPVTIGALALIAAVATGLYAVSYEVRRLEGLLERFNRALVSDRAAIRVLEAEWSYLDQPERLQALAERYLDLVPVAADQIGDLGETLASLPLRRTSSGAGGPEAGAGSPTPGTKPVPPALLGGVPRRPGAGGTS